MTLSMPSKLASLNKLKIEILFKHDKWINGIFPKYSTENIMLHDKMLKNSPSKVLGKTRMLSTLLLTTYWSSQPTD